jgi:hypothetical protein
MIIVQFTKLETFSEVPLYGMYKIECGLLTYTNYYTFKLYDEAVSKTLVASIYPNIETSIDSRSVYYAIRSFN